MEFALQTLPVQFLTCKISLLDQIEVTVWDVHEMSLQRSRMRRWLKMELAMDIPRHLVKERRSTWFCSKDLEDRVDLESGYAHANLIHHQLPEQEIAVSDASFQGLLRNCCNKLVLWLTSTYSISTYMCWRIVSNIIRTLAQFLLE
jgi:hypothetical protein